MRRARSEEPEGRRVRRRVASDPARTIPQDRALPRYEYSTQNVNGHLHTVGMRPIFSGGPNADELLTRMLIANSLVNRIQQAVRVELPNMSLDEMGTYIRGDLIARNTVGAERSTSFRFRLKDITAEGIELMFEKIVQSNELVNIYEIEWEFVMSPSLFQGGAGTSKKPSWWKGSDVCWSSYEDNKGPISCAAVALVNCMYGGTRDYTRRLNRLKKDARDLQDEMGWQEYVSLEQLKQFVIKYPKYRLSVLMHEKCSRHYTYQGKEFVEHTENLFGAAPSEFYIYVYFDLVQKHFVAIRHPQQYFRNRTKDGSKKFCHGCVTRFTDRQNHKCADMEWKAYKPLIKCRRCGLMDCKTCRFVECFNCGVKYARNTPEEDDLHRCMMLEFDHVDKGYNMGENDGKKPSLWVYDLEARIETVIREPVEIGILSDEGYYREEVEFVEIVNRQIANYCFAINVFTGERLEYFGDSCLVDFLTFMLNHNEGYAIALAHNGGGYDTRLIYESLLQRKGQIYISKPIMRGSKFIELKVNTKLMFRDSRNHLNGALAGLARDFETPTLKGYFPHLFNSIENYDYDDKIPDKTYFDLSHFRNDKEFEAFITWHDSFTGKWCFKDELKKYCINDVEVLSNVVLKYHDIYMEKFAHSPWRYMTSSSYFHKISKIYVTKDLELPEPKSEDFPTAIANKYDEAWTILRSVEYAAARQALRGGRTGIGRIMCELTPEQIARGCKIKYVDVVSLYPYQQVAHDFPVGPPKIHVFDPDFAPCIFHRNSFDVYCECELKHRYHAQANYMNKMVDVEIHEQEWDVETILNTHGFVMATVQPPMMLHPILVRFDEEEKKCNATCELLEKGCFTSAEFHTALRNGYKLIKLHRFDEYKMKSPLWEDFVKEMYIFKMVNSAGIPDDEKRQKLVEEYEEKFEMGDMIIKTFEPNIWGKNPARKAAAKTGLNSGWGKHAQRIIQTEAEYVDWQDSDLKRQGDAIFHNIQSDLYTLKDAIALGQERYLYKYIKDGNEAKHPFNNSYLPAACFVPAYGRLQLWEQLNKLGDRVLMYDTDSVVYIYDPDEYNVAQSKIWGGWEEEDISSTGITGFLGLGPKSYAMRCVDESQNVVKLKGISQKRATSKILNYYNLKKLVLDNISTRENQVLRIPQTNFEYRMTQGIFTVKILKLLSFDFKAQKGMVGKNFFMYPKGYVGPGYSPL